MGSGFETTFQFQLTHQGGLGHGADGFAFVLQNSGPEALGGHGSARSFAVTDPEYHHRETAIPWRLAVFFDTYRNEDQGDPSANYVAFCTYGKPREMGWPARRAWRSRRICRFSGRTKRCTPPAYCFSRRLCQFFWMTLPLPFWNRWWIFRSWWIDKAELGSDSAAGSNDCPPLRLSVCAALNAKMSFDDTTVPL